MWGISLTGVAAALLGPRCSLAGGYTILEGSLWSGAQLDVHADPCDLGEEATGWAEGHEWKGHCSSHLLACH